MPFTLTHSHVASLFTFAAAGNPGPLLAEVDPDVAWRVGASEDKGAGRAGVYVSACLRRARAAGVVRRES